MSTRLGKLRHGQRQKRRNERTIGHQEPSARRSDITLVYDAPGEVKMSAVLLKLVEPEVPTCYGPDKIQKLESLLTLGAAAWNLSLLSPNQRETAVEDLLLLKMPDVAREDILACVEPMIRRKEQMFPHLRRPILDFEVSRGSGIQVQVNVLSDAVSI